MSSMLSKTHMHRMREAGAVTSAPVSSSQISKTGPPRAKIKVQMVVPQERKFSEKPYPRTLCYGLPSPERKAARRNPNGEQRAKGRIKCGHFVLAVFFQVKYDVLSERGTTRSVVFMEEESTMNPNSRHYINLLLQQYIRNIRNIT